MKPSADTVLFVELPGFSELSGHLPSKSFHDLLNKCYEITDSSIRLHQGALINFSGDTFMAVFDRKQSNEDPARQATGSLNEFRERLRTFLSGEKLPVKVGVKAGIASGDTVVEEFGSGDKKQTTVMGEAVGLATRLCEFAQKGQILVNKDVFEAANELYLFQKLEPLPMRGSKESLEIFELGKKKRQKLSAGSFSERRIASEMVGREREAIQMESLLKKLVAGQGTVVNIVGRAGIGKSRLAEEMKVQGIMKEVVLLEGRALSVGQNLSFHPIVHIVKSWAGITDEDPPIVSSEKLRKTIQKTTGDRAGEIYPFMATMMGLPLEGKNRERVAGIEGEALEKLILKNLRDLIIIAAGNKPLIILIEDMHWADSSSISFFESLFKLSRKHPVMFINIFRPGYKDTGDYILKQLVDELPDNHITISINPLSGTESLDLMNNLLNKVSIPGEIQQMIISKTEGNPFFIEEVIRSFLDEGIIEIHNEEFLVTDRIHEVNIPETINDVIISRVDKLDEKTRELLKTASVMGRNFYYKVLEEAADTISEMDDRIEYLKEVQLIGESKTRDEIEYLFKHALAQQATYESIVLNTKKELHLKIARSIEKVFAANLSEHYGSLAYHYERAENREKMEDYLVKAGDEAMRTAASSEAISYFEKVLSSIKNNSVTSDDEQRIIDIEEQLAYAYYIQGQNRKSATLFIKVLSSFNYKVPKSNFFYALKALIALLSLRIKIAFWKGKKKVKVSEQDNRILKMMMFQAEAIASYAPKDAILRTLILLKSFSLQTLVSSDYGINLLATVCLALPWSGRGIGYGRMLTDFTRSVVDLNNKLSWLYVTYSKVMADYLTNRLEDDKAGEKIFKFAMETGNVWAPTVYHSFKGISYVEMGLKKEVGQLSRNMLIMANELENSFTWVQYHRLQYTIYVKFREMDEAIDKGPESIRYIAKTDHTTLLLLAYCFISMAYTHKGQPDKAKEYLLLAEELTGKLWLKYYVSTTLLAKCYILFKEAARQGKAIKKEQIAELLKTSQQLVKASKNVYCNKTEAYRFTAMAYAYANKPGKALKFFNKSIDFSEWYGAKLELSRTYFELGKFLSGSKTKKLNGLSGEDYLEKAKTLFTEMDLQWDLEEYGKYLKKE